MATENEIAFRKRQEEEFRLDVERRAGEFLSLVTDPVRRQEATARVALAFRTAAWKEPKVYQVTPVSVARAIANCALTGLMPGGPRPGVELIPRATDGVLQLEWQVTAEGWIQMARWAGWTIDAVPVFEGEHFEVKRGGLVAEPALLEHEPDFKKPWTYDRLVLFYILARRGDVVKVRFVQRHKIEQLRKLAQTQKVWGVWDIEMAEKAAIAYALRRRWIDLAFGADQAPTEDSEPAEELDPRAVVADIDSRQRLDHKRGVAGMLAGMKEDPPALDASAGASAQGPRPPPPGMADPAADREEWKQTMAQITALETTLSDADRVKFRAEAGVKSIRTSTPIDRLRVLLDYLRSKLEPPEPAEPVPDLAVAKARVMELQAKLPMDLCNEILTELGIPAVDGAPVEDLARYIKELEFEVSQLPDPPEGS